MDFIKWLDGKKTIIGAIVLFAAAAVDQVIIGVWGADQWWLPKLGMTLDWSGMAIAGIGLGHKLKKNGKQP